MSDSDDKTENLLLSLFGIGMVILLILGVWKVIDFILLLISHIHIS